LYGIQNSLEDVHWNMTLSSYCVFLTFANRVA